MPNKACLFPGTTKKLHILHLLLCSVFTFHMPNCVIVVLLYVSDLIFLVTANHSSVTLENNLL